MALYGSKMCACFWYLFNYFCLQLVLITGWTLRKVRQLLEEFIMIIINGDINIHMSYFVLVRKCLVIALWPPSIPLNPSLSPQIPSLSPHSVALAWTSNKLTCVRATTDQPDPLCVLPDCPCVVPRAYGNWVSRAHGHPSCALALAKQSHELPGKWPKASSILLGVPNLNTCACVCICYS